MYNAPVVTINVSEGAALGVAILAGVGTGAFKGVPEGCGAIIGVKEKSKPSKKMVELYERQYKRYGALYPAMKGWFAGG
jgi:xylulokinase